MIVRLLWGLSLISLLLDLCFTYSVLALIRDMNHATSSPFFVGANWSGRTNILQSSSGVERVKRVLSRRNIGSPCCLSSAVLAVFHKRFSFVPLPLPFIPTTSIPILSNPSLSYGINLGILSFLSQSIHPVAGVVFGTLSGMLWSSNLTSFLIEAYWSNGSIILFIVLSLVSLKAAECPFVPCIDHVSWDRYGREIQSEQEDQGTLALSSNDDPSSDSDEDSIFLESQERQQDGSMPFFHGENDDEEDESVEGESYPLLPLNHTDGLYNATTMRSRRTLREGTI